MCPPSSVGVTPLLRYYEDIRLPMHLQASSWFASCATLPCPGSPSDLPSSRLYLDDATVFDPVDPDALVAVLRYCFPDTKRSAPTVLFCYRGSIPSRFRIAAHHLLCTLRWTCYQASTQHSVLSADQGF